MGWADWTTAVVAAVVVVAVVVAADVLLHSAWSGQTMWSPV